MRRALPVLVLLVAAALAGCVGPDVDKSAITSYLNAGTTDRAIGCPFPVAADAEEGIAAAEGARDLAVAADGRILLAEPGRIRVVSTNYTTVGNWSLPLSTERVRVAAGTGLVAAVQAIDATAVRVTTFTPDGTRVASRNLTGPWDPGVDVDGGQVRIAGDPTADGADLAVYASNLTLERRVDLDDTSRVHGVDSCQQRLLWLDGGSPGANALRVRGPDARNGTTLATFDDDARHLAVGQDLALVAGGDQRRYVQVLTLDGTRLVELSNRKDRSHGRFAVAHDLVYNLRGDAVLVRPLADFLTRPS